MTEQPPANESPQPPQSPAPPQQEPVAAQPVPAAPPPMARQGGPNGMSVAALVCGILSLLFSIVLVFLPFIGVFLAGPLAVLAVIFGFVGRNQAHQRTGGPTGLATAGIITGLISLLITILGFVGCGLLLSQAGQLDKVDRQLQQLDIEQPGDRNR